MSVRTIAFNKPYGVLPCFTDPEGRPTLAEYITVSNVYAAGRLDQETLGGGGLHGSGGADDFEHAVHARELEDLEHGLPWVEQAHGAVA